MISISTRFYFLFLLTKFATNLTLELLGWGLIEQGVNNLAAKRQRTRPAESHLLRHLITLAGSQTRFAQLCGVSTSVVTAWLRNGISRRGAVLVSWSKEFKNVITYRDLRPDIDSVHKLNEIVDHPKFVKCRERQLQYETTMDFAGESPMHSLAAVKSIIQKGDKNG